MARIKGNGPEKKEHREHASSQCEGGRLLQLWQGEGKAVLLGADLHALHTADTLWDPYSVFSRDLNRARALPIAAPAVYAKILSSFYLRGTEHSEKTEQRAVGA